MFQGLLKGKPGQLFQPLVTRRKNKVFQAIAKTFIEKILHPAIRRTKLGMTRKKEKQRNYTSNRTPYKENASQKRFIFLLTKPTLSTIYSEN